ncbi:hypothetical protein FOL47_007154 [Perkinsus chesapeaki]|uniref:Uncharacterized protein n=1 Tax=Perkinsus chesapeaki TaxID=330153 RepID=A0A7J6LN84_PERCH|nr:hypothetical protein FOL47_007154 [Perkinsus chesapeaki]
MDVGVRSTFSHWPEEDIDGFARLQVAAASTYCDTTADLSSRLLSISATVSEVFPSPGVSRNCSDQVRNDPPIDEIQSDVDDAYRMLASALDGFSDSVQFHSSPAPLVSQSPSNSLCNKRFSDDDEELMDMILREADV